MFVNPLFSNHSMQVPHLDLTSIPLQIKSLPIQNSPIGFKALSQAHSHSLLVTSRGRNAEVISIRTPARIGGAISSTTTATSPNPACRSLPSRPS
jgi:hypothetical protein